MIPDISEIEENKLIERQMQQTVQTFPDAVKGTYGANTFRSVSLFERKSVLGVRGTQTRIEAQHAWYHHEDNSMFQSIISGLTKRVQSLPYEVKAPEEHGDKWDNLLRYANFDNWENFISQLVIAYSVYDIGAFIEIIAPGDPLQAPAGAATGIAVLDSRRCFPTGDPQYPVIYSSRDGRLHLMHRARVFQFIDMTERDEELPGWGKSALSRCMSAIYREVLAQAYMRASLDDMPAPGFAIAKNLTEQKVMQQIEAMQSRRENDQDVLGRLVFLYGADTSQVPSLEFQQFQHEFTGFDPDKLSSMNAKYMAAGVGVDLQDFWELSGRGIGTATQSEILNEKSKGRALGRLIKGIERMINDVLPDDAEFTFKYRNEEEDLTNAQTAQAWAGAIATMSEYLTVDEKRIIAANQVPALKDAITDADGVVLRYNDSDPQTPEQVDDVENVLLAPGEQVAPANTDDEAEEDNLVTGVEKDFRRTAKRFREMFNDVVKLINMGITTPGSVQILIMDELRKGGRYAYLDGLKRTGKRRPPFDERGEKELALWLAAQRPLVAKFVNDVRSGKYSDKELFNKGMVWANSSLTKMLYIGMAAGQPKKLWLWKVNPKKEHCRTCLRLNGQVHMMKTYASRGLLPQSSALLCNGYNCGCQLVKVPPGTKPGGRLSGIPKNKSMQIKVVH